MIRKLLGLNGAPAVHRITPALLKHYDMECSVIHNELVELRIGRASIKMDHPTALKLSQLLRVAGKQAKRQAGDRSSLMSMTGTLTDAENDYKHGW